MQSAGSGALVDRMIGAARLDEGTYEAIEHDEGATGSAALIVVLAAIAIGIGSLGDEGFLSLIGGIISGLFGWVVFSVVAYYVGARFLAGPQTSVTLGQVLRTLGFANTPRILSVVGFIPILGPLVAFVASIWFLVASVVALRHAFDVTTGRAAGIAVVSFLALILVTLVIALILGTTIVGISSLTD